MPEKPVITSTKNLPPPAYFLSITVSNLRCFGPEPQTLDLSNGQGRPAQWTIIIGENGTGKTTLLQSCIVMQHGSQRIPQNSYSPAHDAEPFILLRYWAMEGYFNNELEIRADITTGGLLNSPESTWTRISYGVRNLQNSGLRSTKSDIRGLVCYGYGASRRMSYKGIDESRNSDTCKTLYRPDVELINAEEWLILTDYATKTGNDAHRQRAKDRYVRIRKCLIGNGQGTGLLPDVEDFRFTTTDDSAMTPRVEAKTPYGWVRVRDLSLGYQASLSWMIDFASRLFERYPDSENPLAEPAICLVDEIDLHLHPRWQRELVRVLTETFPNTQFIVTAHSPLIVQAAPNANLALLRREEGDDHVTIVNDVDYIRSWRVDQILASDLFGEIPVHAPEVEQLLEERTQLRGKTRLTAKERTRLAELDEAIGRLPTAVHPEDQKAMDIIREAAELLRAKQVK